MKRYKYRCRLCGEGFDDLFDHLHEDQEELKAFKDRKISAIGLKVRKDHLEEYNNIERKVPFTNKYEDVRCFCGGKIITIDHSNEEIASWVTECEQCGFLWDED
ncbi:MAG TPA: hypothetical protein PLK41_04510 [Defluviitoga tunisiensis]|nr:hypothetical protein [bacterium]HPP10233.1 hypothetical protein [Defluviitoga tunisiensis]